MNLNEKTKLQMIAESKDEILVSSARISSSNDLADTFHSKLL